MTVDTAAVTPDVVTCVLPVEALHPNDYNPNRMTQAEHAELLAEVRHLGRVPKPIVVRPAGDGYVIVDGEHGWRAAREAGLAEIPCEVIVVDDFEAMRQTYKRNQHGTHNPVLLGRMFRRMLAERELSNRSLAAEMEVSEGTVRNALLYAEAADARNSYAAEPDQAAWRDQWSENVQLPSPDDEVARLSVRSLREYLRLPPPIGDIWVSAGADLKLLAEAGRVEVAIRPFSDKKQTVQFYDPEPGRGANHGSDEDRVAPWRELVEVGLHAHMRPSRFVQSARWAFAFLYWRQQYGRHLDADAYMRPVFEAGLKPEWLDRLPCRVEHGVARPAIPADVWAHIVGQAAARSETYGEVVQIVQAGLDLALYEAGLRTPDVTDPRVGLQLAIVREGPAFIRDAAIPLSEQAELVGAGRLCGAPEDAILEAKRRAVHLLEEQHTFMSGLDALGKQDPLAWLDAMKADIDARFTAQRAGQAGRWRGTAEDAFEQSLEVVTRERREAELGLGFADPDVLMRSVANTLRRQYGLEAATVGTMVARFQRLPRPEWLLLAALVLDDKRGAMKRYLGAVRDDAAERPAGAGA